MKDNEMAAMVNELTIAAKEYYGMDQLRERLSFIVKKYLSESKTEIRLHQDDISSIALEVITIGRSMKRSKIPRKSKDHGYTPDFEENWKIYPKRPGNNKNETSKCYEMRKIQGESIEVLSSKTQAYVAHCDSSGKTGTSYVLMGNTFYGVNKRYLDDWPTEKAKEERMKLPIDNNKLESFAKKHKLPLPAMGETYPVYRKRLSNAVELRV